MNTIYCVSGKYDIDINEDDLKGLTLILLV